MGVFRYSERSPAMLLEIVTVLPEEIHSRLLRLGDNRRQKVIEELEQCAPNIINFLVCNRICLFSKLSKE